MRRRYPFATTGRTRPGHARWQARQPPFARGPIRGSLRGVPMAASPPALAEQSAAQPSNRDKLLEASAAAPQQPKILLAADARVRLNFPKQSPPPHVGGYVRPSNVRPVSPP